MREHYNLPATFNYRIHAFSFDYGILALVALILVFIEMNTDFEYAIKIGILVVVWYGIKIAPSFIKKGNSIGRHDSKIIVKTDTFEEVSLLTMHLRESFILLMVVLTSGLYFFIAYLFMQRRVDKRAFHDLFFHTCVVRIEPFVGKSE
jgi:uncharacterized RDD family membrane protein YckC